MGFGERLVAGSGALLLVCLLALPWFAISANGEIAVGSEAGAFRWLDAIAVVLLGCAVASVALPVLRSMGTLGMNAQDVAVIVGSAGLATVALIGYRIAVAPEAGGDFYLQVGLDPDVHVTPRVGAALGLLAGVGMLIGGALSAIDPDGRRTRPPPAKPTPPPARERKRKQTRAPARKRTQLQGDARMRFSDATEQDLRRLGLTLTQARRVLRYRDELGLISAPADLDAVPGIPPALRAAVQARLRT
jgi:hypothetical protein